MTGRLFIAALALARPAQMPARMQRSLTLSPTNAMLDAFAISREAILALHIDSAERMDDGQNQNVVHRFVTILLIALPSALTAARFSSSKSYVS
jgi:hypothetical protein